MTSPPAALAALFSRAVQAIQNLPPAGPTDAGLAPTNTEKLEFYALYKQATTGPLDAATTKRPGFFDPVGRAKYDTWLGKVRLTRAEAMRAYTDLFMAFLRR
ncbi:acyl-CoA-binding protein, partial [Blastocladiella britannica]